METTLQSEVSMIKLEKCSENTLQKEATKSSLVDSSLQCITAKWWSDYICPALVVGISLIDEALKDKGNENYENSNCSCICFPCICAGCLTISAVSLTAGIAATPFTGIYDAGTHSARFFCPPKAPQREVMEDKLPAPSMTNAV
jgi:hypothetical protein